MKTPVTLKPTNPATLNSINRMRRVIGKFEITLNQAALLSAIPPSDTHGDNRVSPSDVADIMGISRGGITRLVRPLLDRKLITQERSSLDMRYVMLKRTRKGDSLVERINVAAGDPPTPKQTSEELFV